MVAIAGTVGPSRRRRSNHFFSDTGLHLDKLPGRLLQSLAKEITPAVHFIFS